MGVPIELQGVTRQFGGLAAVDSVDLRIQEGEFFVVLGPSGCGKTTLLRLIAGLAAPDRGDVRIGGVAPGRFLRDGGRIGMVFQGFALYPAKSVWFHATYPIRSKRQGFFRRKSRQQEDSATVSPEQRARDVLTRLDLYELSDRLPDNLSGGEQQRVALARAMVARPSVLLLDEPMSSLDASLRERARREILELWQEYRTTIVYVTHDQSEAMRLAERVALLRKGKLVQVGTWDELLDRPQTAFVACFVGDPPMVLLDADVAPGTLHIHPQASGASHKARAGLAVALPGTVLSGLPDCVTIGIPVDGIEVCSESTPSTDRSPIVGAVTAVERSAHGYVVHLQAHDIYLRGRIPLGVKRPASGDSVRLRIIGERLSFFDKLTGSRLHSHAKWGRCEPGRVRI